MGGLTVRSYAAPLCVKETVAQPLGLRASVARYPSLCVDFPYTACLLPAHIRASRCWRAWAVLTAASSITASVVMSKGLELSHGCRSFNRGRVGLDFRRTVAVVLARLRCLTSLWHAVDPLPPTL